MKVRADAPPLAAELAREPRLRQTMVRPVQGLCDVSEFDKCQVGRDCNPPYDHRGVVVVASAWLAFYIIAVTIAFGSRNSARQGSHSNARLECITTLQICRFGLKKAVRRQTHGTIEPNIFGCRDVRSGSKTVLTTLKRDF
jgi:hypothetical protein